MATNPDHHLAAVARQRGWRILHLDDGASTFANRATITRKGGLSARGAASG